MSEQQWPDCLRRSSAGVVLPVWEDDTDPVNEGTSSCAWLVKRPHRLRYLHLLERVCAPFQGHLLLLLYYVAAEGGDQVLQDSSLSNICLTIVGSERSSPIVSMRTRRSYAEQWANVCCAMSLLSPQCVVPSFPILHRYSPKYPWPENTCVRWKNTSSCGVRPVQPFFQIWPHGPVTSQSKCTINK